MPAENDSKKPSDPMVAAFDEFRESWLSDNRPDPEAFCESHSDCGPSLRDRIDNFIMVSAELLEEQKFGDLAPEKKLGDFRIIREIGRGGMGVVYEAEQITLGRKVALKILPSHLSFSEETVLKFRREAKAGGRQSHPGIVAIHGVGKHEGIHYIAQELVEDSYTLDDKLEALRKEGELPPGYFRDAARCIADSTDALHHAHEAGVIHRDVKPSNILLTPEGKPKITDFGLAKLEDAMALSRTGDFAGTPFYMSPEQVTGRGKGLDRRTDIYSLGVTLYEMLTLRQPFDGKSSYEVLKKIPVTDPTDPWRVNPRVPKDLSTICLKAMEKSPEKRYPTMKEFGDDLRRYLSGEVVIARPAGITTKILKRVKRNPLLSGALGAAVLAILALMVWGMVYFIQMKNRYAEIRRHSDLNLVSRLKADAERLWPAYPRKADEIRRWIEEVRGLMARDEQYREDLNRLISKDSTDVKEAGLRINLEKLIWEIDSLGNEESGLFLDVRKRLRFAETIIEKSIERCETDWNAAVASIADETECPRYESLVFEPIVGFVPIGRDPDTKLWEFAHLQTGEPTERDKEGKLVLTEETGLVFVLIPGGTFQMGSRPPDEEHPEGKPNVDPDCDPFRESPVREVHIEPFLLSKYEMTQGQWFRFTGNNPSTYDPTNRGIGLVFTLLHPVETVSWHDCFKVLGQLNLIMPHEAQREYAYRAGTSTIYYTGNDYSSLRGFENLADAAFKNYLPSTEYLECVEWDDGHAKTAPVGSYDANPFGLHDMAGNVGEWCGTRFVSKVTGRLSYDDTFRQGIDEYGSLYDMNSRILRGGSFASSIDKARASFCTVLRPAMCDFKMGIRPAMRIRNIERKYVATTPLSTGNGRYVPDDYPEIQKAIDASREGDTIVVRPGAYPGNIDFLGKAIHLKSELGPSVTILDGNGSGSVVVFRTGEGPDAILEGFTLKNGTGYPWEGITRGGGILCDQGSSPTIKNNIIMENSAYIGGAICIRIGSSPEIMNNIIHGNSAEYGGGGIQCNRYISTMTNNTICNNTAGKEGGGMRCAPQCDVMIVNTIFWNNHAPTGSEIYIGTGSSPHPSRLSICYSNIMGGKDSIHVDPGYTLNWGPGMIDVDPLFTDLKKGDLHLTSRSPCRNAGDGTVMTGSTDFEVNARISNDAVDMGADEF